MTWLRRNTGPVVWVLLAAALVIGVFEVIDSLNTTTAPSAPEQAGAELEGLATLAGLVKVTLFLVVSVVVTLVIRRGLSRRAKA